MVAFSRLVMSDLARQKRLELNLHDSDDVTPEHSVGQAIDYFLGNTRIQSNGLRFTAFSRGVMLDSKRRLKDLEPADQEWTVMPEVSAG